MIYKGPESQDLIGSAVAGFNLAQTITIASVEGLDTRQDDTKAKAISAKLLVVNLKNNLDLKRGKQGRNWKKQEETEKLKKKKKTKGQNHDLAFVYFVDF